MTDQLQSAFALTPQRLKRYGTAFARKLLAPASADGEPLRHALELYRADVLAALEKQTQVRAHD